MKSLILLSVALCLVSSHAEAAGTCKAWYNKKTKIITSYQCSLTGKSWDYFTQCQTDCKLTGNGPNITVNGNNNCIQYADGSYNHQSCNTRGSTKAYTKSNSRPKSKTRAEVPANTNTNSYQNYLNNGSIENAKNDDGCKSAAIVNGKFEQSLFDHCISKRKNNQKVATNTEVAPKVDTSTTDGGKNTEGTQAQDDKREEHLKKYYYSEKEEHLYGKDGNGGVIGGRENALAGAQLKKEAAIDGFQNKKESIKDLKKFGVKRDGENDVYSYKDADGNTKYTSILDEAKANNGSLVSANTKLYKDNGVLTDSDKSSNSEAVNGSRPSNADDRTDALTQARNDKKTEKQLAKKAARNARNISAVDKRDDIISGNARAMRDDDSKDGYGGKYGGFNVETTRAVNEGVKVLSTVTGTLAANQADSRNTSINANMAAQGSAATQKQMNDSQADMLDNSADSTKKLGKATVIMGALQGAMTYFHAHSISKVTSTKSRATTDIESAIKSMNTDYDTKVGECKGNATCINTLNQERKDLLERYAQERQNVRNNYKGESDAQKNAIVNQGIATASTIGQGALQLKQAKTMHAMADELRKRQFADNNSFAFNPNAVPPNTTPELSPIEASPGEVIADEAGDFAQGPASDEFNPNIADAGSGPNPQVYKGDESKAPGAATGAGMGAAGSTSAAKDDAKGETVAQGKTASGTYSAGESTGSRFSRAGGGGGGPVGIDSIGDLLKKFLPDGEGEMRPEDNLAFDRTPANDQAAVLGRNQNIFEAIHKRYQKKHTEGAIVFSGDRG